MVFQHQTQQYKQNLTDLNYVHGYFSITYIWPHLKTTSDPNQQKNKAEKTLQLM